MEVKKQQQPKQQQQQPKQQQQHRVMMEGLSRLREEVRGLVVPCEIPRISGESLTALQFHRDYVAKNQPVIITGSLRCWPAMSRWRSLSYLTQALDKKKQKKDGDDEDEDDSSDDGFVTVDVTPDGYGDSVTTDATTFVTPAQKKMSFGTFADMLTHPKPGMVVYCQKQNGNFSEEFKPLHQDTKRIPWAFDAFGCEPDAVNMWIGDQRSVSSLHRDPYENIYCVIKGQKRFTLLPPTDMVYLAEQDFPASSYKLLQREQPARNNNDDNKNRKKQQDDEEEEEEEKGVSASASSSSSSAAAAAAAA
eukprot:CAMPEP_0170168692 /NCGR_PEP_ID=MMETSP0040_2-20121228/1641_1 /TAXON_ID=641309 /ORGANISM="Lotharella oceanica, Strain CCMP622" /LENGTH=305 /DNA_ID=CAMNT_0010407007 /DNA_START=430 /DNA_END=1343 /DNA_ORIENTATION=-